MTVIRTLMLLLLSLTFCAISYFLASDTNNLLDKGLIAKGRVVGFKETRSTSSSKTLYAPKVEFKDKKGETVRFTSKRSTNPKAYDMGEEVEVLYMTHNTKDARIKSFFSLWLPSFVAGFFGLVCALFCIKALINRGVGKP